jgi:hypothetical protein
LLARDAGFDRRRAMAKASFIPLPREWPRIVKSRLLHALGLERMALAEVRAGFESSPRNGVRPRFGAIGKHGSLAVIERFILSLKAEYLRRILVPLSRTKMMAEIAAYQLWYNNFRSHEVLGRGTPAERLEGREARAERPRLEPRARYPVARGDPMVRRCSRLELRVTRVKGRALLPVVELREAA